MKISQKQYLKARQLFRTGTQVMGQKQALLATAHACYDSVLSMETRLRAIMPRYEVVAHWWQGVQDKVVAATTLGGQEWAKLESERAHLVAAIDEAKRETAGLQTEAHRLNRLHGITLEIVRAVAERTQCFDLLDGGADSNYIPAELGRAREFGAGA